MRLAHRDLVPLLTGREAVNFFPGGAPRHIVRYFCNGAGNYKIDNLPDGQYNIIAWHEGMKPQTKPVTVAGTGKADFEL